MARKTNKTSHVLNLITNGAPAEPEAKTAEETGAESPEVSGRPDTSEGSFAGEVGAVPSGGTSVQPAAQAPAQTALPVTGQMTDKKVIVVDDSDSDKISNEIRERLEEHLEQSILQAAIDKAEQDGQEAVQLESGNVAEDGDRPGSGSVAEAEANMEVGQTAESEIQLMAGEGQNKSDSETEIEQDLLLDSETTDQSGLSEPAGVSESKPEEEQDLEAADPSAAADGSAVMESPREEASQESDALAGRSTEVAGGEAISVTDEADSAVHPALQDEVPASGGINPVQEKEYQILNVVERVLGRTNLKDQMKKYDVCTCSRCCADVMALCLTCLPPKYVVVDGSPTAPIIGYYESRNRARIITEIVKACILVKEKPRHQEYEITGDVLK